MKDYVKIWKQLASEKQITPKDMIAYSILRAMSAKSPNKRELARYFIAKAFPKKKHSKVFLAAEQAAFRLRQEFRWKSTILNEPIENFFSSEEEMLLFKDILETLTFDFDRVYTYVFVRQDLTPEYQLVQAAHATMVLGKNLAPEHNPNETYFTVIGVEDLNALVKVIDHVKASGFEYEGFVEPDIGSELTAIAVHPIHWMKRGPLKDYNLLTFSPKVEENVNI